MSVNVFDIIPILQREYLFRGLNKEQLTWIAAQFSPRTLPKGAVVIRQGDKGESFYFVYKGQVRVSVRTGRQERDITSLKPGDFFGEEALLFDRPRSATLTTTESTILLQMDRAAFDRMLKAYPEIKDRMLSTAESRRLARSHEFDFLGKTEVIYFISRRHILFLFRALLISILGILFALFLAYFGLDIYVANPESPGGVATLWAATFIFLLSLLWALWSYADWGNDYFVVTSQRVLWLEKVIGLYDSRREAPLDQVQSVNVNTTQIGRIFDYGDVNVKTFTGGILMQRANQPKKLASFVEGFRDRAQILSKEEEAKTMESTLQDALSKSMLKIEGKGEIPTDPPPLKPKDEKKDKKKKPKSFRERLQNFLKVRYEEENRVITYRKHWFILFRKIWLPLAFTLLLFAGLIIMVEIGITAQVPFLSGFSFLALAGLAFLGLFLWLIYEYLDWRNDIYRLTPEQIFDIERKPLGSELKKTAQIKDILSIEHERKNILGILLNFGDVNIKVGQTNFDFIGVYNPDQVHQDVSDYREILRRTEREKARKNEQKQMVDWLVAFYHQAEGLNKENHDENAIEMEWGEDFEDEPEWDEFSG